MNYDFYNDSRFSGIKASDKKVWLASPTMHGEEQKWINDAFDKNWITTAGENINEIEKQISEMIGRKQAVALSSGTAALHLAIKLAAIKIYGKQQTGHGVLEGKKVFCSDVTFDATVNGVCYENGDAVFIDTEYDTWNMDPEALRKAFELYPDVKIIVYAHLYGTPAKAEEIRQIAKEHNAIIIEDAAESFGATYNGIQTGCFGDYSVISFNGNKIITGSSGGMFLCDDKEDADRIRKWSTQSREPAPWYQHEELGYNYRMSNIIAGVVRGQMPYLTEHIRQKKDIYERYKKGLEDLPVKMNPFDEKKSNPNYWLSCIIIDNDAMAPQTRGDLEYSWTHESGKSSPQEILDALSFYRYEGRPIWKPMHEQPMYKTHAFVTVGEIDNDKTFDVGMDIFNRGLCLPSDNKMTEEQQDRIIEVIKACFE